MIKQVRYIYFDTEFTGLTKDTTLISIGCVTKTNNNNYSYFYAEFIDYNKDMVRENKWIKENVIDNLLHPETKLEGNNREIVSTKANISRELKSWIDHIAYPWETIQFVSDVAHYDFVLLIDLLTNGKTAFALPEEIVPACSDINSLIATKVYAKTISENLGLLSAFEKEAFNISREKLIEDNNISIDVIPEKYRDKKHNSLYDAFIIALLYNEFIIK